MASLKFFPLLCLLAACAPSPLYVRPDRRGGTVGEIPRDGSGEPLWSAIRPALAIAAPPPGLTVNPGVPITAPPAVAYAAPAPSRTSDWVTQTKIPPSVTRTTTHSRTTTVRRKHHRHKAHRSAARRGTVIHRRTTTLSVTR